jgi:hypothetical protein
MRMGLFLESSDVMCLYYLYSKNQKKRKMGEAVPFSFFLQLRNNYILDINCYYVEYDILIIESIFLLFQFQ